MRPKIPKPTKDQPYIEFSFSKKGHLSLSLTNSWWGGINGGFVSSDGSSGNSCKHEVSLPRYIERFKKNKFKKIDKELERLQKERKKIFLQVVKLQSL